MTTDHGFSASRAKNNSGTFLFIPNGKEHAACVALTPCSCVSAKSSGTNKTREQMAAAIRKALVQEGAT